MLINSPIVRGELRDGVLVAQVTCEKIGEYEAGVIQTDLASVARGVGWRVVLNLKDVQMIASAGLGMIVSINKSAKTNKGALVLCHLNDHLRQLLKATRLDAGLTIKPDEAAAMSAAK
jgi:anti-anti-sigma factor